MKKLIITLVAVLIGISAQAKTFSVEKAILESGINNDAISVSIKNTENGKILFQHNPNSPITPASTLKAVTYK